MTSSSSSSGINQLMASKGVYHVRPVEFRNPTYTSQDGEREHFIDDQVTSGSSVSFGNIEFRKLKEEGVDVLYIKLPQLFIQHIIHPGKQGVHIRNGLKLCWQQAFQMNEDIDCRSLDNESSLFPTGTYVRVPQWASYEHIPQLKLGDSGKFNGFITFAILSFGKDWDDPRGYNGCDIEKLDSAESLQHGDLVSYYENVPHPIESDDNDWWSHERAVHFQQTSWTGHIRVPTSFTSTPS